MARYLLPPAAYAPVIGVPPKCRTRLLLGPFGVLSTCTDGAFLVADDRHCARASLLSYPAARAQTAHSPFPVADDRHPAGEFETLTAVSIYSYFLRCYCTVIAKFLNPLISEIADTFQFSIAYVA